MKKLNTSLNLGLNPETWNVGGIFDDSESIISGISSRTTSESVSRLVMKVNCYISRFRSRHSLSGTDRSNADCDA